MKVVDQTLEEIIANLSPLVADWQDEVSTAAIAKFASLPRPGANEYGRSDMEKLFEGEFDIGILCARTILGLSKDTMDQEMRARLPKGRYGSNGLRKDPDAFYAALEELGLPVAMMQAIDYKPVWSDILVERLRGGRGSAISGQTRGRNLENLVENMIIEVFGPDSYDVRCLFVGREGKTAKCDFAIPSRDRPRIIIEVKGYAATGSKMSDVIGDIDAITGVKRNDSSLLFFTDGMTWEARTSDLRKIVRRQNEGEITRIYTTKMRDQFVEDLRVLRVEAGL